MNKEETIVNVVALATGAAVGFGVGYYVQKKKYEKVFAAETRDIAMSRKEGIFATPEGAVKELIGDGVNEVVIAERPMSRNEVSALLVEQGYAPLNGEDVFDADQIQNETGYLILDNDLVPETDGIDDLVDEEVANTLAGITGEDIVNSIWQNTADREALLVEATANEDQDSMPEADPNKPYVITVDQFMTDTHYDDNKVSLLYFEGDDQMVDEREQLVNNIDEIVGRQNLQHFGLGSRDRNALYIRNEQKQMDIEIIRDTRTYMEVIHGVKPNQQATTPRKMRDDDQ